MWSAWLLPRQVLVPARVRVGDPARAGQPADVPAGQSGPGLVGTLIEVEDCGARVVLGAGVVIAEHGQIAPVARVPSGSPWCQGLAGQPGWLWRGVGVERRLTEVDVAEPEAEADHLPRVGLAGHR